MDRGVTIVVLCFVHIVYDISPIYGSYCTKKESYYRLLFSNNCGSWWNTWCRLGQIMFNRQVIVYYTVKKCCPGYLGKECNTPICQEPCLAGYQCTSPDLCTQDSRSPVSSSINNSTVTTDTSMMQNQTVPGSSGTNSSDTIAVAN